MAIVGIQAGHLQARLGERGITLELTTEAAEYIAKAGYDPVYGARPLKRVVQRQIESALARKLLAGEIREGSKVQVSVRDGNLVFDSQPVEATPPT